MPIAPKPPMTLYNTTNDDLYVMDKGQQIFLPAYGEESFPNAMAESFLSKYPGKVVHATELQVGDQSVVQKPRTIWIANMTGNPDCPELLDAKEWRKKSSGGPRDVEIPHPARAPRPLKEKMLGTWVERQDGYGNLTADRGPSRTLTVPPYQRVEMPYAQGRWFLRRVSAAAMSINSRQNFQLAIAARAPGEFEPNGSWDLDELRGYMRFIDRGAPLPDTEADIRKKLKKSKARQDEIEFRISKEKRELLKRLFFKVVNPDGPTLPSREEFMLYMNADLKPEVIEVDAMETLSKVEAELEA